MEPLLRFRLGGSGRRSLGRRRRTRRALAVAAADLALLARRTGWREALAAEIRESGRVDVLANNACVGYAVPATRERPGGFMSVFGVNLCGSFWMAQACPHTRPRVLDRERRARPRADRSPLSAGGLRRQQRRRSPADPRPGAGVVGPQGHPPQGTVSRLFRERGDRAGLRRTRGMVAAQSMLGRFGEQEELDSAPLFRTAPRRLGASSTVHV